VPKKIGQISQFHGGLNSSADPRDINDDQFSDADKVTFHRVGRIMNIGSFQSHSDLPTPSFEVNTPGTGLFRYSHDYQLLTATNTLDATPSYIEGGVDYYVGQKIGAENKVLIYQILPGSATWYTDTTIDLGGDSTDVRGVYYVADGVLYVCDGNFAHTGNSKPIALGHIDYTLFSQMDGDLAGVGHTMRRGYTVMGTWGMFQVTSGGSSHLDIDTYLTAGFLRATDKWTVIEQDTPPDGIIFQSNLNTQNILTSGDADTIEYEGVEVDGPIDYYPFGKDNRIVSTTKSVNEAGQAIIDAAAAGAHFYAHHVNSTDLERITALSDHGQDVTTDAMSSFTHSCTTATGTKLVTHVDTITGNELAGIGAAGSGVLGHFGDYFCGRISGGQTVTGTGVSGTDEVAPFVLSGTIEGQNSRINFNLTDNDGTASATNTLTFQPQWTIGPIEIIPPVGGLCLEIEQVDPSSDQTAWQSTGGIRYLVWKYCYEYQDGRFSPLSYLYGSQNWTQDNTLHTPKDLESGKLVNISYATFHGPYPDGVIGLHVFYRDETDRDEAANWYRAVEYSFISGPKIADSPWTESYNFPASFDTTHSGAAGTDENRIFTCPHSFTPQIDGTKYKATSTYALLAGGLELTDVRYKTAVVTNRRAYVGNIMYKDPASPAAGDIRKGDAILKSDVDKFGRFTAAGIVEASVGEGDEIIKLNEYADRILQFKKDSMELINVSQEVEFLEETYRFKGIANPAASCRTDYGIAWVNRHGVYLYDGNAVGNLFEKDGVRMIGEDTWEDFLTELAVSTAAVSKEVIATLTETQADVGEDPQDRTVYGKLANFPIDPDSTIEFFYGAGNTSLGPGVSNIQIDGDTWIFFNPDISGVLNLKTGFVEFTVDETLAAEDDEIKVDYTYENKVGALLEPSIGYDPKNRHLIINSDVNGNGNGNSYHYDLITRSWSKGDPFATTKHTNFINDVNGDLLYALKSVSIAQLVKWDSTPVTQALAKLEFKDHDFGNPAQRKKVYRVRLSYRGVGGGVIAKFYTNGDDQPKYFKGTDSDGKPTGSTDPTPLHNKDTDEWHHAELKPDTPSEANNIYSFQFILGGIFGADFEINDVSIVYREKNVK
jgi:hypothetical protein|tara:strand:+ start:2299 stop:5628 length:3330 start_codon:yes stop_codon:yes gene_type:complete